jgi:hypothetical protein
MDQIPGLNLIPEKYRGLALFIVAVSPYLTRAYHAIVIGGGIKGVFSAIWLGTNTPAANKTNEKTN